MGGQYGGERKDVGRYSLGSVIDDQGSLTIPYGRSTKSTVRRDGDVKVVGVGAVDSNLELVGPPRGIIAMIDAKVPLAEVCLSGRILMGRVRK